MLLRVELILNVDDATLVTTQEQWRAWAKAITACPEVSVCGCTFAAALTSWPERPRLYDVTVEPA